MNVQRRRAALGSGAGGGPMGCALPGQPATVAMLPRRGPASSLAGICSPYIAGWFDGGQRPRGNERAAGVGAGTEE